MKTSLREIGRVDHHPRKGIKDGMKGVTFDYHYTGQRIGSKGQIEISVTSIVTDCENNIFYRTCRYLGHYEEWKRCIRSHIIRHLSDLGIGIMLVRAMTDDFKADKSKCRKTEDQ